MSDSLHHHLWVGALLLVLTASGALAQTFPSAESGLFTVNTSISRVDTDHDGMPDAYEERVGLNPLVNDANADPDGDGLINLREYNAGTGPFDRDVREFSHAESALFTVTTRTNVLDTDSDGMPDWWEMQNGLQIDRNDVGEDPDGDGITNLQEYNSGTNPRSNDSPASSVAVSALFTVDTSLCSFPVSLDSDQDGMPDWWERKYGLNPLADDASGDSDHDGVSNLAEYRQGRNPSFDESDIEIAVASGLFVLDTIGAPPDTDGDGMRDYWEIANGLDPKRNDANEDPDGDGRTNLQEYNAGTDPHVDDWHGPSSAVSPLFVADTGGFDGSPTRDSDGDGMPDWWEMRYGLNPNLKDSGGDFDGDGITNLAEYNAGTSPVVHDGPNPAYALSGLFLVDTGGRSFDTDGDGLPDWWEKVYFNDPRAAVVSADSDGDGCSNLAEFLAGSDPMDNASVFRIVSLSATQQSNTTVVVFRWMSFEGATYSIWGAVRPEGPYSVIATNIAAAPPVNSAGCVVEGAYGFFRVRSEGRAR